MSENAGFTPRTWTADAVWYVEYPNGLRFTWQASRRRLAVICPLCGMETEVYRTTGNVRFHRPPGSGAKGCARRESYPELVPAAVAAAGGPISWPRTPPTPQPLIIADELEDQVQIMTESTAADHDAIRELWSPVDALMTVMHDGGACFLATIPDDEFARVVIQPCQAIHEQVRPLWERARNERRGVPIVASPGQELLVTFLVYRAALDVLVEPFASAVGRSSQEARLLLARISEDAGLVPEVERVLDESWSTQDPKRSHRGHVLLTNPAEGAYFTSHWVREVLGPEAAASYARDLAVYTTEYCDGDLDSLLNDAREQVERMRGILERRPDSIA